MRWPKHTRELFLFILLIASTTFIVYKINQFNNWEALLIGYSKSISLISLLLILLCVNIFFEAKKWQTLLSTIINIKLSSAIKMVLAGFTSGIFTPFRAGEPIGRVAFLEKKNWKYASILSYFGGALQNVIILSGGLIGLLYYPKLINLNSIIIADKWLWSILGLTLIIIIITWQSRYVTKRILQSAKLRSLAKLIKLKTVSQAILYSIFRYFTFSLQLYISLYYLGGIPHNETNILLIFIYYLLVSIFPSHILIDVGIRGSVALFIFNGLGLSPASIFTSVFFVWLINQALPALVGAYTLVSEKDKSILKNIQ